MRSADGMKFQAAAMQKIKGTPWERVLFPKGDASQQLNTIWRELAASSPNIRVVANDYVYEKRAISDAELAEIEAAMFKRTEDAKAKRKDVVRCMLCGSDHAVGYAGPNFERPLCDACSPEPDGAA